MPRFFMNLCALFGALCLTVPTAQAREQDADGALSALVYPSGARMRLERTLTVKNGAVSFELPRGADVQSLDLAFKDRTVVSMEVLRVPGADNPAVAALRASLDEARRVAATLEGERAALQARLALWSKPPARFTQAADLEKTDAFMAAHLARLHTEQALLEPRLKEALRVVERLETRLGEAGGDLGDVDRITARVYPDHDGEAPAQIVFTLNNCGWKPAYRLDALPAEKTVRVTQLAEIYQGTGLEWKNVALTLTTANPGAGLNPLPLRPWVVRPLSLAPLQRNAPVGMAVTSDAAAPKVEAMLMAPVYSMDATSSSWELGTQDVPTGIPVRLVLAESAWKADFVRVLRPSQGKFAYLRARVTPPEPAALPGGAAQFLVDGTSVGKGLFSFSGSKDDIFFGEDQRVSAKMVLDTQQSGSRGFINKKQTRAWVWSIDVRNAHVQPVDVLVEEPAPQLRNEDLTIDLRSSPKPKLDGHDYVWRLTVPGGDTITINHAVTIAAPAEMRLDDGR